MPQKNTVLITSNRDENSQRKQAVPPSVYRYGNKAIVYPKDANAGGTWIAMKNNGHAAVLLNGAFENHIAAPPYRKSRGLVFLEIIADTFPVKKFADIFLNNIEPFTLILFGDGKLYESRWNGTNKFITELDSNTPHIWSSATLYDAGTIKKRAQWFTDWLVKNPYPSQQQVLFFHQFAGDGDSANSLHINRNGIMLTVSVTSMSMQNDKAVMRYLDLKNKNIHEQQMKLHSQFQAIY